MSNPASPVPLFQMRAHTILLLAILAGCGSQRAAARSHAAIRRLTAPILRCQMSEVVITHDSTTFVTAECRSMAALLMWLPEDHQWGVMSTGSTLCGGTHEEEPSELDSSTPGGKSEIAPVRWPVRDQPTPARWRRGRLDDASDAKVTWPRPAARAIDLHGVAMGSASG